MATDSNKLKRISEDLLKGRTPQQLIDDLAIDTKSKYSRFPNGTDCSDEDLQKRWKHLSNVTTPENIYAGQDLTPYVANIENCIGTVKMPLGVAGPLRGNGTNAKGDFLLPLATTEAALVASYHRGAVLISKAGGCSSVLMSEGVTRSPGFAFKSIADMMRPMNLKMPKKMPNGVLTGPCHAVW